MASLLALKKLVSSNLLPKSLHAARRAIPASRLFNSKAGSESEFADDDDFDGYWTDGIGDPCPDIPDTLFQENLNMMDKIMDSPSASRGILPRRWEATKTEEAFYVRMNVPEWTKENVEIRGKHNYMAIRESFDKSTGDTFEIRIKIEMPSEFYKSDRIKAQMKNGVLKIVALRGPCKRERAEDFYVEVV
ncbi:hypothetical protein Vadar_028888 [Vaccinium darrowii]|uniref:Uncharacterized protein n=1 Tax=Vaccinium darrowii TaxID=229202 RepID=A0ACB7YQ82_9ERIC|nr:hypothetical protein Vadar_028888 [Vaccinium darrowii]